LRQRDVFPDEEDKEHEADKMPDAEESHEAEKLTGNTSGGEITDLIIVGESKSERMVPSTMPYLEFWAAVWGPVSLDGYDGYAR
jgi:hypothetical protein